MTSTALRIHAGRSVIPIRAVIATLLALSGCVSPVTPPIHVEAESVGQEARLQRELRFRMAYEQQQRVVRVTFPMLTAGAEMCGDTVHYVTGVNFSNRRNFELGSEAIAVLGLTDEVKITSVVPGSPADVAGAHVDDFVIAVDGFPTSKGAGAAEAVQTKLQPLLRDGKSFGITLARDGVLRETTIVPVKACSFSTAAIDGDVVNAFADGTTVTVTVGMLRFVQDDTELALVISHELAHNLMRHVAAKSSNEVMGWVMNIAMAVAAGAAKSGYQHIDLNRDSYSEEFEAEADYVGLYMMARAGLQIDRAPQFWRRMGAAYPASNKSAFGASHPSDAYRMLALKETVQEIGRKISAGLPLTPERGKSSLKKPDEVHAEPPSGPTAPYRITFLLDHRLRNGAAGEKMDIVSDPFGTSDPLKFEDKVNRCLGEAMRRVTPSMSVTNGAEFRRAAFPDLGPSEAPHSLESLLALRKSATFQGRIAPLGLQYIGIAKVASDWSIGSAYMPSQGGESRFSISVIDVGGQAPPYREEATFWRSSGPGNVFDKNAFVDPDSRACAELGERLAASLARRTALPLSVHSDSGP